VSLKIDNTLAAIPRQSQQLARQKYYCRKLGVTKFGRENASASNKTDRFFATHTKKIIEVS
jgi:hypothetical protein